MSNKNSNCGEDKTAVKARQKPDKIKRMLDACYLAKRIRELLPELPEGVTPAYIQYMDVIHNRQKECPDVKVSDISDALKLPRPGVTRTVKEMEEADCMIQTIQKFYAVMSERSVDIE